MNDHEYWVDKQLFRLRLGQFLERAAEWLAGFFILFGILILLTKLAFPWMWPNILWVGIGIIPCIITAGYLASMRSFQKQEAVVLIDKKLNAGGLLMTVDETQDQQWTNRSQYSEEQWKGSLVKIRPTRFLSFLLVPVIFATLACLIPVREIMSSEPESQLSSQTVKELQSLMEILEQDKVLSEKEKKEIEKEIQQLLAETENKPMTNKDWETVDALKKRMQLNLEEKNRTLDKAQAAVDSLYKDSQKDENKKESSENSNDSQESKSDDRSDQNNQNTAENESQQTDPDGLTDEERENLEQALENALNDLNENGGLENLNGPQGQKIRKQIAQMKKLKLGQNQQEREDALEELKGFLEKELEECEECKNKCEGECEGFCDKEGEGDSSITKSSNKPGAKGISRGRGDAKMTWGKESDSADTKFKEVVLPPGFKENPKDKVIGISFGKPQDEKVESAERNTSTQGSGSAGKDAWNRQLHPRHKSIIKDYFDK